MVVKSATRKRFSAWNQQQGFSDEASAAPRRILMTTDTVGGVWHYSLELVRGLAKFGVEVALATMGPLPTAEQRRQVARIHNITLFESSYRLEWMEDPWEDVEKCGAWLMNLEDELKPDLVHLNGYAHADLPWNCPCMVVAHSCVLSWWEAVKKEPIPQRLGRYRERVAQGLARAHLVAAPTAAMLNAVETSYLPLPIPGLSTTDAAGKGTGQTTRSISSSPWGGFGMRQKISTPSPSLPALSPGPCS